MTSRNIMWRTTECTQRGNCGFLAVHSIMKEKSAQAGEGGGARPPPFTLFTIRYKVAELQCTLQLRGQKYSPYFISILYVLLCVTYTRELQEVATSKPQGFPQNHEVRVSSLMLYSVENTDHRVSTPRSFKSCTPKIKFIYSQK
jgi:hypothetical protein